MYGERREAYQDWKVCVEGGGSNKLPSLMKVDDFKLVQPHDEKNHMDVICIFFSCLIKWLGKKCH